MPLDLDSYEDHAREGVRQFWSGRSSVLADESTQGGERGNVLSGKNLDGFLLMIRELIRRNGLPGAEIFTAGRPDLTLPGYFRPTKLWDVLVLDQGKLVAAIEMKSHVGSFGNNFNNRAEEAIGSALDLLTAVREDVLGTQPMPFLGWLILVEDSPDARKPTRCSAKHFKVFDEFLAPPEAVDPAAKPRKSKRAPAPRLIPYLKRYDLLCQRLMKESLYTRAALLASPREAVETGEFTALSQHTSLHAFAAGLAGHVAAWSA